MYNLLRGALLNGLRKEEQKQNQENLVFTKETFGVVLILFATLCLVCLITRETIFAGIGLAINSFLFGCFGFFAYAVIVALIGLGVILISGKSINMSVKRKALTTLGFLFIAILAQLITTPTKQMAFGEYLAKCYSLGQGGISTTSAGGLFAGMVAYGITSLLTDVGSYVIMSLLVCVIGFFVVKDWLNPTAQRKVTSKFRTSFVKDSEDDLGVEIAGEKEYPVAGVDFAVTTGKQKLFVNNPEDFALKNKREMQKDKANPNGIRLGFSPNGLGVVGTPTPPQKTPTYTDDYKKKLDYIKTPKPIDMDKYFSNSSVNNSYSNNSNNSTTVSGYVNPTKENEQKLYSNDIPMIEHDKADKDVVAPSQDDSAEARARMFGERYFNAPETEAQSVVETPSVSIEPEYKDNTFNVQEQKPEINQTQTSRFLDSLSFNVPTPEDKEEDIPFIEESFEDEVSEEQPIANEYQNQSENEYQGAYNNQYQSVDYKLDNQPEVQERVEEVAEEPKSSRFLDFAKDIEIKKEEQKEQPDLTSNRRIREIFDSPKEEKQAQNEDVAYTSRVSADNNLSSRRGLFGGLNEQPKVEEKKPEKVMPPINRKYHRPPFDLLETYAQPINTAQENHEERKQIIQKTLEEFHINAVPQGHVQGPSVTRYEIMMPAGVSVKKVLSYDDDLKMRLSARQGVRIEAPIPGKNLVGIEVANNVKVTVGLKEVMEGLTNKKPKDNALMFALGKDIVGNSISDDLTKGPHYLIAGATGSGKSVALHVMIVSLLMRYSPEELKLVLVDPKSVEFRKYEHIPHLLVDEIVTEPKRALTLLQWAYDETNRRNEMFTACGGHISNISDYNEFIANDTTPKLPRIVFVIDELADLMEACKKDLEARIRMIAAKSRSAGIHLVLATQRPSVDVITGTIKANLPSRIALKVMNFADSQTILGEAGAEKLLGNGDMLYKNSSMADYERYQGAYISGREIANIVSYIKENNKAYFDSDIMEFLDNETKPKQEESAMVGGSSDNQNEFDELFLNALWTGINAGSISISLLQRRFSLGHGRAGGIIDKMERLNLISPYEGAKARKVLMTKEEFIDRFGPRDEAY